MAAKSSHYGDVFNWVMSVIESCNEYQQVFTAHKLVDNFCNMTYPSLDWSEKSWMNITLIGAVHDKQYELLKQKYDRGHF